MAQRGLNKVMLIGHLGQDPDIRATPSGTVVANVSLATGETWKDQQGNRQERTEWHRIVMFGKTAEIARDYLRKGSKVYLEGRLQTRKWQDKEGKDQYTTEIVTDGFQMLDGKPSGESGSSGDAPRPSPSRPAPAPVATPDFDDDLPF